MGSVINYIKCPQCGGVMVCDFDYHSTEEFRWCKRCGKKQSWYFERDKNYKIVLDENQKPIPKEEDTFGYGYMFLVTRRGIGSGYCLEHPATQEDVETFLKSLEDEYDAIDKRKCYFTYWDVESSTIKSHYGKIPGDYVDECGE